MADNSSRKFKFISPGVFIDEIDNSQLPAEPSDVGPMIIGRARKGPAMKPVQVNSFNDFVETFGNPVPGGSGGDVWRNGNTTSPMYAPYAAQAWLRNNSPLTFMRLVGHQDSNADTTNRNGQAGWYGGNAGTENGFSWSTAADGGAWALCVVPTGSTDHLTGAVAAIFYVDEGRVLMSGNTSAGLGTGALTASACMVMETNDGNVTLAASKTGVATVAGQGLLQKKAFSLRPEASNFIRNVFNTNPTIVNDEITTRAAQSASLGGQFWLGQSFERSLSAEGVNSLGVLSNDLGNEYFAFLLPMKDTVDSATNYGHNFKYEAQRATTGFFISQDLDSNTASFDPKTKQQLFRLEALSAGRWAQEEIKISISNIKAPVGDFQEYGTFSVLIRSISDTDNEQIIIERFDGLNLNPASSNYIARVIGDKYEKYDSVARANRTYGRYENRSNYVRVVMNEDVDRGGMDPMLLPFGVFGQLKYRDVSMNSGSVGWNKLGDYTSNNQPGVVRTALSGGTGGQYGGMGGHNSPVATAGMLSLGLTADDDKPFNISLRFPASPLRQGRSWGSPKNNKNVFWGMWTGRSATSAIYNEGLVDYLHPVAKSFSGYNNPASTNHDIAIPTGSGLTTLGNISYGTDQAVEISWVFTLDDVSGSVDSNGVMTGGRFSQGLRKAGQSRSALTSWSGSLSSGIDRFTTCLHGGYDGWDITERDPLRLGSSGGAGGFFGVTDETKSYQLATLKQAINIVSDPEDAQYNIITIPGIVNNAATSYLLEKVEERSDALAVIDIQNVYKPSSEDNQTDEERNSSLTVKNLVDAFDARSINNSYGAAYAPWVLINDTITNRNVWVPPSVAAVGALSTTDRIAAPWFAPAGFQRGGLSEGAAGIPVLDVSRRFTSDDRDSLYESNINPIAKFPAEGIVVFGQKTLQQTQSALDRINVRRLLIFLKREISFIASRLLFAPNTRDTWTRFIGQATPVLDSVKAQFGIEDFRLILDESTTTPDLIDRNIIYAKLLVKPTRAAEFFAIDMVITNSGASFDD